MQLAFGTVYANFVLVTIATLAMIYALVTHDFSVSYVAQVGQPRDAALLHGHLAVGRARGLDPLLGLGAGRCTRAAVVWINRKRPGNLVPWAAVTLLAVALFFAILLVGPANPFHSVFPVPADGPGPNPLLQNHILMAVHPPLLYLGLRGHVGAVRVRRGRDALGRGGVGRLDQDLRARWTLIAWALPLARPSSPACGGRTRCSGWGGYWAWDPVENASFIPWLTATAFLHSVMVQERRGMLKLWNLNLMVGTFVLTILGTFLTRSGIISSRCTRSPRAPSATTSWPSSRSC